MMDFLKTSTDGAGQGHLFSTSSFDPESIHLLAVDDDPLIREVLMDALSDCGYQVTIADSAENALDLVKSHEFHLVISDVAMPGLSGVDLADHISRMLPDVPIVLITGYGTVEMAKNALRRGASDFLIKPFNVQELPIVVARNLERRILEARRLSEQGEYILLKAIKSLAKAIDAKDCYTAGHSDRVTRHALCIAERVGLSDEDTYQLRLAAEMHDVGKIGVPDAILNKRSALTPDEWELMRQHSEIGSQIIGEIEELGHVASIIRHHHERMDGTGYPDGLRGNAIPYLARIVAVADTYEAMTSDRAYRRRFPETQARELLRAAAGSQLDRELVVVFLESLGDEKAA